MTSIPRAARRLVGIAGSDRRLFAWAFLRIAAVDLELRLLGFERLLRRQDGLIGREARAVGPADVAAARERARWLEVASRHHFVYARCLHRALALHGYLRGQCLPSELRIGVRKEGLALVAHAWVELAGEALDDSDGAGSFVPLQGSLAGQLDRRMGIPGILGGIARGDRSAESIGGATWRRGR